MRAHGTAVMASAHYKRRRHAADRRGRPGLVRLVLVLIGLALAFGAVDARIRPAVESMSAYQAKIFAVRSINDAMGRELENAQVRYGDIVTVTRSRSGEVTSIQTDMLQVNSLKSRMVEAIILELEQEENRSVRIPAGTLLGNQFTSGLGPDITVHIIPSGYVQSEIYNQFTSAGINQTLHQVMLKVNVQMLAVLPGYTVQTDTATNYCIAQTVIVGTVPEGFTEINGDDSSTISKINDYSQNRPGDLP